MEESSEVHSQETKLSPEKNRKRRLKTPSQVEALEKFYNEHKYPTEEMKSQLAEEIGLTEKQISGWFCHRRLKDKRLLRDEAYANGRQDHSSGVVQDRGSGLRQDSCGSTKQGDYRRVDPREVESRRLYGQDISAADLTHENRSHRLGNVSGMDDTSSESSSALQDRICSQSVDPYHTGNSRYPTKNEIIMPNKAEGAKKMGYKPSGYLKVKGEVENAAITAVKRQLGRHYREDGPPLGVEFQPLPPGAFESPIKDPDDEPCFVGDPALNRSPDISGLRKQAAHSTRYGVHNSKMSSQDVYMEGAKSRTVLGSYSQDNKSHGRLKRMPPFLNHSSPFPGQNSSMDIYEDSVGDTSAYNSNKNDGMCSKRGVEGMRSDSGSDHHYCPYGGKITGEQTEPWLHNHDYVSHKIVKRSEHLKSKPSNVLLWPSDSFGTEERGPSRRMAKDKLHGERKAIKQYHGPDRVKMHPANESTVVKRVRDEFPQQDYVKKASFVEVTPWTNQAKGSVAEMPSSFSEDETAETNSSVD